MQALIHIFQNLVARLRRITWLRVIMDAYARLNRDNGWLLSAGLSFYLILAFVPLLLVGLWALGLVYSHHPNQALHQIQNILPQILPAGSSQQEVTTLMVQAKIANPGGQTAGPALLRLLHGHGLAGALGILTTVWAAIQIFVNGSTAMNAAWETQEKRNWFMLRLVALGLLIFTGLLLAVSLGLTALSDAISKSSFAHVVPFEGALLSFLAEIVAIIVSTIMYAVVYRFLPAANVPWRSALAGGLFAAITWEIAKKALAVYLLKPNTTLYGDLGSLIVFILWVLYSMLILLLGAEVAAVYKREVEQAPVERMRQAALPASTPTHIPDRARPDRARPRSARNRAGRGGPHAKR